MSAMSGNGIEPCLIWEMEYMLYHSRPYGIVNNPPALPKKIALGEIMWNGTVVMKDDIKIEEEEQADRDMDPENPNILLDIWTFQFFFI